MAKKLKVWVWSVRSFPPRFEFQVIVFLILKVPLKSLFWLVDPFSSYVHQIFTICSSNKKNCVFGVHITQYAGRVSHQSRFERKSIFENLPVNFGGTPCKPFTQWVSRVLKYPKKCLEDLTTFFMSTWWGDSKNMEEIEFSRWLFELPAK